MNKTAEQAEAFCRELLKNGSDCGNRVIIFVPYTDLSLCARLCENSFAAVGAQNVHWENSGAFTGEISAQMLREAGAEYVLTGHSERRALFGETDETVAKRTAAALKEGLKVVMCVGETLEQRESGLTEKVLEKQLRESLKYVDADMMGAVSVAYEPVWAIGTGKTASAEQARDAGMLYLLLTGGEPLVRKADILKLAEKHNDVEFAIYTNSTLIDEPFCKEVVRLGNIAFMLSIEGTPETNDARRGEGHYAAVINAMDLLKKYGIIFGTSICYTRDNIEAVTNDEFMRFLCEKGAHFGFYFHYMPVGNEAAPELMPTPEQRKYMIDRIRYLRSEACDIPFYPMDFQNDGEFVGGCIAGGRNYFHINSAGDAEPCVFIHYSNANIHDQSILEILHSPLFMAYHNGQPFNKNHLRPCPMLENPQILGDMVRRSGAHSTDMQQPQSPEDVFRRCRPYATSWMPTADRLWAEKHPGYVDPENPESANSCASCASCAACSAHQE